MELRTDGGCMFFDRARGNLCRIHRDLGHHLLPVACQHFPRVVRLDDCGIHVTLSHFCPTAAGLLFRDDVPLEIVEAPGLLPFEPQGLDARGALPPLVAPDVLMDLGSYGLWEREAVRLLARDDRTPEQALGAIASATARIARWRPGVGTLSESVDLAFAPFRERPPGAARDVRMSRPLRYYLAAKIFGSWTAFQADRLTAVVATARRALRLVRTTVAGAAKASGRPPDETMLLEAIRDADHRLLHRVIGDRVIGDVM
jgi:hypothetical protein